MQSNMQVDNVEYYLVKFFVTNETKFKIIDKITTYAVLSEQQMSTFRITSEYTIDVDEEVRYLEFIDSYLFDGSEEIMNYINYHQFAKILITAIDEDIECEL